VRRPRLELLCALALVGIAGGPFLFGGGVDFPDDAIYHSLPLWEWLEFCFQSGRSPWFVPGKLGGVSLASDSVPMGPLYPACWLLAVLPARMALPLAMLLHALGTLLAVRWLAGEMGASQRSATLAGAGVALGTTGLFSFIDCQADTMPLFLWFPVALACLERLDAAGDRAQRLRWASLAAAAIALLLLGSHLRWAAATGAALVLWCVIRLPRPRWTLAALALGLAGGLPGYLPQLLEWRESALSTGRFDILGSAAHNWVDLWNVAGILAPKPVHLRGDYSIGLVLGVALLLVGWRLRGPVGRLAVFALLLYLAPFSTEVPGLRYLFAPLLVLTHPVNHFYAALATLPAAVAAAACLDRVIAANTGGRRGDSSEVDAGAWAAGSGVGRWILAVVAGLAVLRAVLPERAFFSDFEWGLYLLALGQAVAVAAGMFWLLRRGGPRLSYGLFALALIDLATMGLRFHLALPATPIPWTERTEVSDVPLRGGYLHLTELADLEPFQYDGGTLDSDAIASEIEEESALLRTMAVVLQDDLLGRRWPIHLGLARGLRSGSGAVKMPPRRAVAMLSPLADALVTDTDSRSRLEDVDPEAIAQLFTGPDSVGIRTLRLLGLRNAVGPGDMHWQTDQQVPRCYLPASTELVEDEQDRIRLLLEGSQSPARHALLETAFAELPPRPTGAQVSCPSADSLVVRSPSPVLTVLRERYHPGWTIRTAQGQRLQTFPVNQVHMGVVAPGDSRLQLSFSPPGMKAALASSGAAWLLLALALLRSRMTTLSQHPSEPATSTKSTEGDTP